MRTRNKFVAEENFVQKMLRVGVIDRRDILKNIVSGTMFRRVECHNLKLTG